MTATRGLAEATANSRARGIPPQRPCFFKHHRLGGPDQQGVKFVVQFRVLGQDIHKKRLEFVVLHILGRQGVPGS